MTDDVAEPLHPYLGGTLRGLGGDLLAIGGVEDHVHLLIRLKPRHALADIVREIKTSSSKWLRREKGVRAFAWQTGYAAFTASESRLPSIRRYLANQREHHRTKTFKEELQEILDAHGVSYETRFLD